MICAIQSRRKFRFSRTSRTYAPSEPISGRCVEAHALFHQLDGGVCDRSNARGAVSQHALYVARVGDDIAIALLEGLQIADDHFGDLLLQVPVAHPAEARAHLSIVLSAEGLIDADEIEHA